MRLLSRQFIGNRLESGDYYVTTEFISCWFLPIWPVASYRVLGPKIRERVDSKGEVQESLQVTISWSQVVEGWLLTVAVIAILVFLAFLAYVVTKNGWNIN